MDTEHHPAPVQVAEQSCTCVFDADPGLDETAEAAAQEHLARYAPAAHHALLSGTCTLTDLTGDEHSLHCLRTDWLMWTQQELFHRRMQIADYDTVHAILIGTCHCDSAEPDRHATGCPADPPPAQPVPYPNDEPSF